MMFVVAFVVFGLVWLWREQDVAQPVRSAVESWLAQQGWIHTQFGLVHRRGRFNYRAVYRFAWKVLSCAFCLSWYVCFVATWFALDEHPWHREFWLTWWGAWGVVYVLNVVRMFLSEGTMAATAVSGWLNQPQPDDAERKPDPEEVDDSG